MRLCWEIGMKGSSCFVRKGHPVQTNKKRSSHSTVFYISVGTESINPYTRNNTIQWREVYKRLPLIGSNHEVFDLFRVSRSYKVETDKVYIAKR
jgi:hypothetical protein